MAGRPASERGLFADCALPPNIGRSLLRQFEARRPSCYLQEVVQ